MEWLGFKSLWIPSDRQQKDHLCLYVSVTKPITKRIKRQEWSKITLSLMLLRMKLERQNLRLDSFMTYLSTKPYLGDVSMFRTFDFKDGKPLTTPIYYVDN